jgi:cobalamin biosynthetic protein CobC
MSPGPAPLAHGGDLAAAARRFGVPAAGWLDLSTGINPNPYPLPGIAPETWARLPQADAEDALLASARACYGVPPAAAIVAAPGSEALIRLLPRLRATCRVAVISTTYADHADSWAAAGHRVRQAGSPAEIGDAEICIVVNPNNPDGRITSHHELQTLADTMARRGGWLIVDEAFADTAPETSIAGSAGRAGLVILRSFGKFFGLAGLRLGFAVCDAATGAAIAHALGPWAVSGPAMAIGTRALSDRDWIARTRDRLNAAASTLDGVLSGYGYDVIGGTALYRLVATADAGALHHGLAVRGILTRIFAGMPDRLRIGAPGAAAGFERLVAALGEIEAESASPAPRQRAKAV